MSAKNGYVIDAAGNAFPLNTPNAQMIEGKKLAEILLEIYPVGSIYLSVNSTSPASLFGGTWTQLKGRFLLACGNNGDGWDYSAGSVGGEPAHQLTADEMPYHQHYTALGYESVSAGSDKWVAAWNYYNDGVSGNITGGVGGNGWHNNMPPYLAVYMWKRVS